MNTFSFLWMLLVVILTISNMYLVFKYLLDRYLLKSNQKINIPSIQFSILVLVLLIKSFCDVITDLSKNDNSYELIEILSLNRIEPLIVLAFIVSSCFIMLLFWVNLDLNIVLEYLNGVIIFVLILTSSLDITKGLGTILSRETTPPLSALHFETEIFFVYRMIVFPSVYLVSYILFWFISKRKTYNKNGSVAYEVYGGTFGNEYDKNIKLVDKLKNSVLYFYLIFIVGMIYLKLKHSGFFLPEPYVFLTEIIKNSFIFIIIYIGISYYTSNKDNKTELFGNLFKKIYVLITLFPVVFILVLVGYYILQEVEINIIITITAAILAAVTTCILNFYITRYFHSKN